MKLRVVSYYRNSKKSKNGIKMQKVTCNKFSKQIKAEIIKEYQDKGFSGISNRPGLNKMIQELETNKVNAILVYKLDRLGRDFYKLNDLIKNLEKKDIKLISATQTIEYKTPEGKFNLRLLTALAEFERNITSKRIIDGLNAKKR